MGCLWAQEPVDEPRGGFQALRDLGTFVEDMSLVLMEKPQLTPGSERKKKLRAWLELLKMEKIWTQARADSLLSEGEGLISQELLTAMDLKVLEREKNTPAPKDRSQRGPGQGSFQSGQNPRNGERPPSGPPGGASRPRVTGEYNPFADSQGPLGKTWEKLYSILEN